MNKHGKPLIGVHIEDGIVQRVSSNDGATVDSTVIVFDDGRPLRALRADKDDGELEEHAKTAMDSTRCHGIGIACDLAGERLIELGRTKFNDPKEFVNEIASVIDGLADLLTAAMRLRPVGEG